jgi:hypothetical protein
MRMIFKKSFFIISLLISFLASQSLTQQKTIPEKKQGTFQGMQKAMQHLNIDTKQILVILKPLTLKQKNAVIAFATIMRAAAIYESLTYKKKDTALQALYNQLSKFSKAYCAPGKLQGFTDPHFQATVDCLSALKECEDRQPKPDNYDCDSDPKVIVPCVNEFLIFMEEFEKLHKGIPDILDGKDPWPPIPFPY